MLIRNRCYGLIFFFFFECLDFGYTGVIMKRVPENGSGPWNSTASTCI